MPSMAGNELPPSIVDVEQLSNTSFGTKPKEFKPNFITVWLAQRHIARHLELRCGSSRRSCTTPSKTQILALPQTARPTLETLIADGAWWI